jgi:hypothetical protein
MGNSLSGAIVAIAATDGESGSPDQPGLLTGLVARMRQHVNETILADGSSGEPLGYQDFDLEGVTWTMSALERAYGIDFHAGTRWALRTFTPCTPRRARTVPRHGRRQPAFHARICRLARRNDDARLRRSTAMPHEPVGELVLGPQDASGPSRRCRQRAISTRGRRRPARRLAADATVFAFRAGELQPQPHGRRRLFAFVPRGAAAIGSRRHALLQ